MKFNHTAGRTCESFYDVAHEHPNGRVFKYEARDWNHGRHTLHQAPGPDIRRVSYSDLGRMTARERDTWPMSGQLFLHNLLSYGDYSGATPMHRSNVDVFLDEFGDHPDVYEMYGGYGSRGVAIALTCNDANIHEALDALDSYPVLDEDHWCALELELEQQARDDYAIEDFWQEVVGRFDDREELYEEDEFLLDEWPEQSKQELFEWAFCEAQVEWIHEDPNLPYVDTGRMAAAVTLEQLLP